MKTQENRNFSVKSKQNTRQLYISRFKACKKHNKLFCKSNFAFTFSHTVYDESNVRRCNLGKYCKVEKYSSNGFSLIEASEIYIEIHWLGLNIISDDERGCRLRSMNFDVMKIFTSSFWMSQHIASNNEKFPI